MLFSRDRSVSEASSNSESSSKLSKSPVGFWYIRPGSSSLEDGSDEDDDEPICWTPSSTPSNPPGMSESEVAGPPHILSPSGLSTSNLDKLLSSSNGTTIASPTRVMPLSAEFHLEDDDHSQSPSMDNFALTTPPPPSCTSSRPFLPPTSSVENNVSKKTMVRSMSYTAFSSYPSSLVTAPGSSKPMLMMHSHMGKSTAAGMMIRSTLPSSTQEHDLFRTYFLKFVDLLVVRETERLVHHRASTSS